MSKQTQTGQSKQRKVRPIFWAGGLAALCLAFLFSSVRFEMNNHLDHHHHTFNPEEARIRSLTQACVIHAAIHEDNLPDQEHWEQILLAQGLIEVNELVSLAEDGDGVSYIFVPGLLSFSPTQILVYEDPKHYEDGVLVGFADTHVEKIDHDTFERMLAEQLAVQGQGAEAKEADG